MEIKNNKIIFTDDHNQTTELNILFTWKNDADEKEYVFFYADETPEEIIAGYIDEDGNIADVEDDDEYDVLDEVLKSYLENEKNS